MPRSPLRQLLTIVAIDSRGKYEQLRLQQGHEESWEAYAERVKQEILKASRRYV
jgi:hypothetical protein